MSSPTAAAVALASCRLWRGRLAPTPSKSQLPETKHPT